MSRASRVHVPESIYYVRHVSRPGRAIFFGLPDCATFETILASVLRQYRMDVYAFRWERESIRFVCCVREAPLSKAMRTLMSRYRRAVMRESSADAIFGHRHGAVVVDPQLLPEVTRHIHRVKSPNDAICRSSYPAYLGEQSIPWLHIRPVLRRFAPRIDRARIKYRAFVEEATDPARARMFEHGADTGEPIRPDNEPTLQDIIDDVLVSQGTTWEDTISDSRKHVLTRALIAWHAVEHGVETRSGIARLTNTSESALRQAIDRHRRLRPELFVVGALRRSARLIRLARGE